MRTHTSNPLVFEVNTALAVYLNVHVHTLYSLKFAAHTIVGISRDIAMDPVA